MPKDLEAPGNSVLPASLFAANNAGLPHIYRCGSI
jgi:hypothetical protein